MKMDGKLEPILLLLFAAMIFFTATVFIAEHFYPNDGQLFQVVSNLLSGISGAFLMRVKPPESKTGTSIENPAKVTTTTIASETQTAVPGPNA